MIGAALLMVLATAPEHAVTLDAGAIALSARAGDVVIPLEAELPLWKRLRWYGRFQYTHGTGAAEGLNSDGVRLGLRWYPSSDEPNAGFFVGLHLGADFVVESRAPKLLGPRVAGGLGAGYGWVLFDRWVISAGAEVNPLGLGFPNRLASLRVALGVAF